MAKYKVKAAYSHLPALVTIVPGTNKAVNLKGEKLKKTIPATTKSEKKEIEIPAASDEEMAIIFEAGNACIEKVTETTVAPK